MKRKWQPLPGVTNRRAIPMRTPDRSKPVVTGKYVVSGRRAVHGGQPGDVIELSLPEEQLAVLIESGNLTPYTERAMPTPDEEEV